MTTVDIATDPRVDAVATAVASLVEEINDLRERAEHYQTERDQMWDATGIGRDQDVEFVAGGIRGMVDTARVARTQLRPQLARAEADAAELRAELERLRAEQDLARCRVCGCTDEQACDGGCTWVEDPRGMGDLCSTCLPDVEGLEALRDGLTARHVVPGDNPVVDALAAIDGARAERDARNSVLKDVIAQREQAIRTREIAGTEAARALKRTEQARDAFRESAVNYAAEVAERDAELERLRAEFKSLQVNADASIRMAHASARDHEIQVNLAHAEIERLRSAVAEIADGSPLPEVKRALRAVLHPQEAGRG